MKTQELSEQDAKKVEVIVTNWGLSALGFAAGGITAMVMKRGVLGVIGFAVLGSMLGNGIGMLMTRKAFTKQSEDGTEKQG